MTKLVNLNDKWRIDDDPLQWILKRRDGAETYAADGSVVKPARWVGSAYCATRAALLSNIRERAGDVDPMAVAFVETWPERHVHGAVLPLVQITREAA